MAMLLTRLLARRQKTSRRGPKVDSSYLRDGKQALAQWRTKNPILQSVDDWEQVAIMEPYLPHFKMHFF